MDANSLIAKEQIAHPQHHCFGRARGISYMMVGNARHSTMNL
jgi:hypothetical protein